MNVGGVDSRDGMSIEEEEEKMAAIVLATFVGDSVVVPLKLKTKQMCDGGGKDRRIMTMIR